MALFLAAMVIMMTSPTATSNQVAEAGRINTDERLWGLKVFFLWLGAISLLAIFLAGRLPRYVPGEVPSGQPQCTAEGSDRKSA